MDKSAMISPVYTATTGTGLDDLVEIIVGDPGLDCRLPTADIQGGAAAADAMNNLIVDAIRATGLANDGNLNMADVRDLSQWLRTHAEDQWITLHGDDENGIETGFHLVQNDGASSRLFATNAVNNVADGIYHLGFEIERGRFLNEDGNKNISVETMSEWLGNLLEDDLADGSLANATVDPYHIDTSTGTGLDRLVDIITGDTGLNARIATSELYEGANAAADLNALIIEAIRETGIGDDGVIGTYDLYDVNHWLRANALDQWTALHGDDENGEETGFHLVQNDGASSRLFATNAVNNVADGLYHIGFEIERGRFLNEDGNKNASVEKAAYWLNELLEEDLAAGTLANPDAVDLAALQARAVYRLDSVAVDGPGDQVEVDHDPAMALANGTFSFSFIADEPEGWDRDTLFSKDAKHFGDGGHVTAMIRNNELQVRLQDTDSEVWLKSGKGSIQAGQEYDVAFSFGSNGAHLYLDGAKVDAEFDYLVGLGSNTEDLTIGANTWARTDSNPDWRNDYFDGQIEDFSLFDCALSNSEIYALSLI